MNRDVPVRLIASDLDGTLLDATGRLAPRTLAAIEAAHDAGIVFAAATGRSQLTAAPRLLPAVPWMRWAICSNGSSLYDLHEQQVIARYPIGDDICHSSLTSGPGRLTSRLAGSRMRVSVPTPSFNAAIPRPTDCQVGRRAADRPQAAC